MKQQQLFLLADATLRAVIDQIRPEQLELAAPVEWSSQPNPTLRDIVESHARDEAWVPDVLAGRTIDEVGDRWNGDILGDDPIAAYDGFNDVATASLSTPVDPAAIAHLSYGDFPVSVYLEHTTYYRAFQAWAIAEFIGVDSTLPPALVDGLTELVEPSLEQLREWHVFGPEVPVPADADAQSRLLGLTGFWTT